VHELKRKNGKSDNNDIPRVQKRKIQCGIRLEKPPDARCRDQKNARNGQRYDRRGVKQSNRSPWSIAP
jgi:hypothetical protein